MNFEIVDDKYIFFTNDVLYLSDLNEEKISSFIKEIFVSMSEVYDIDLVGYYKVDIFIDELKVDVVPKLLGQTMVYGKWIFNGIMFVLVTLIAVILLAKDYRKILDKSANIRIFQICKENVSKDDASVGNVFEGAIGDYFGCQLNLFCGLCHK